MWSRIRSDKFFITIVVNWYNMDMRMSSPSQINFLIFASIFSIISLVYLEIVPKFAPRGKDKFYFPPKKGVLWHFCV